MNVLSGGGRGVITAQVAPSPRYNHVLPYSLLQACDRLHSYLRRTTKIPALTCDNNRQLRRACMKDGWLCGEVKSEYRMEPNTSSGYILSGPASPSSFKLSVGYRQLPKLRHSRNYWCGDARDVPCLRSQPADQEHAFPEGDGETLASERILNWVPPQIPKAP